MNRDYEVGWGKPPKEKQWQKGRSGNPNGRPRKAKQMRPLLGVTPTSAHIFKAAKRTIRTALDGKDVETTVPEVLALKLAQLGMSGNRLAAVAFLKSLGEMEADANQQAADSYVFWSDWRRKHANVPLNWPRSEGDAPLLPHPRDVRIGPRSHAVQFVGPMDEEELPLFEATVVLAELLLVEAERMRRRAGEDDVLLMKHLAMIIYAKAAPSLGGPSPEEPEQAVVHRLVTMALETQSKSNTELSKRKKHLEEMLARAGRLAMAAQTHDQWTDCAVSLSSLTGSKRTARRKKQS